MINVLQVVPTLGYGGVAKVVRNYYEAIDHSKYHFDFVTHGGVEDYHDSLIKEGSKIFYFETIGKIGEKKYCHQIYKSIKMDDYDIIHIHTGDITGIYAKLYRKCGANRIICHAHTTRAVSKSHKIFEGLFRKMALRYSDMTMACGFEAGDYCFGKGNYILLPNSIDFESFNNVGDRTVKQVKQELCIPDDGFVVGHIGHFSPQKNHFFLIETAIEFVKQHPNTYFVLCGDGPRFGEVKRRIEEAKVQKNIILTGIRNDINVLTKVFNMFVLPSVHEGLPVVGIEAQTAGLPCLLSDQIDHRVDIGIGLCKFLPIDQGINPWISEIEKVFENGKKGNPEEIKKALQRNNYDISSTKKILVEAYESLIVTMAKE